MQLSGGSLSQLEEAHLSENFPYQQKYFLAQVALYKRIAKNAWYAPLSSEIKAQESNIEKFRKLDKLLAAEMAKFSEKDFKEPDRALHQKMAALAVFMYLIDKTQELHKAVLKENKVGLYALFDSVRDSLHNLLSDRYFKRPFVEAMGDYLKNEPQLVACAELAGVELVAIHKTMPLYRNKLKRELLAIIEKKPAKRAVRKAKKKPAKKKPVRKKVSRKAHKKPRKKK